MPISERLTTGVRPIVIVNPVPGTGRVVLKPTRARTLIIIPAGMAIPMLAVASALVRF